MNRFLAAVFTAAFLAGGALPASAQAQSAAQVEQQIGQQEYQQLQQKGEIITNSPYYAILNPIAQRIARVANPQYDFPFHFILVHESQPNAFAVPGGNVYVTDTMMTFVQNKEELAGVLCHETSHDIHHDVLNLYQKRQQTATIATIADMLLGGGRNGIVNTILGLGYNLKNMQFSRAVEANADFKGAQTCAAAGLDPFGMVWLMERFAQNGRGGNMEFLSDHPSDSHRIQNLQNEFASSPGTFARFNPDICIGTPIRASGFNNQYGRGCGETRRQSSASIRRSTHRKAGAWKFGPHHIH